MEWFLEQNLKLPNDDLWPESIVYLIVAPRDKIQHWLLLTVLLDSELQEGNIVLRAEGILPT